jgi:hypothetical protein
VLCSISPQPSSNSKICLFDHRTPDVSIQNFRKSPKALTYVHHHPPTSISEDPSCHHQLGIRRQLTSCCHPRKHFVAKQALPAATPSSTILVLQGHTQNSNYRVHDYPCPKQNGLFVRQNHHPPRSGIRLSVRSPRNKQQCWQLS